MRAVSKSVVVAVIGTALSASLSSAAVYTSQTPGQSGDYTVFEGGGNASQGTSTGRVGASGSSAINQGAVWTFLLPTIGAGETVSNAHFIFVTNQTTGTGAAAGTDPTFNGDLYAIGIQSTYVKPNLINRYNETDSAESGSVKIQNDIYIPTTVYSASGTAVGTSTDGDAALASYLSTFYAANPTYDSTTSPEYLFLRISPDADPGNPSSETAYHPKFSGGSTALSVTTTPEPASIAFVAGLMVMGSRRRK